MRAPARTHPPARVRARGGTVAMPPAVSSSNVPRASPLRQARLSRSAPRRAPLSEDVFHFIEDRGIAVGRLVFNFQGRAKLFHQFALVARQLRRRQYADVVVQVALAPAARISQPLALDAKHRAAL